MRNIYLLTIILTLSIAFGGCEHDEPTQVRINLSTCFDGTNLGGTSAAQQSCRVDYGLGDPEELIGCFMWLDGEGTHRVSLFWNDGWKSLGAFAGDFQLNNKTAPSAVFFVGHAELDCDSLTPVSLCNDSTSCLVKLTHGQFINGDQPSFSFGDQPDECDMTTNFPSGFETCVECTAANCAASDCQEAIECQCMVGEVRACTNACGTGQQSCIGPNRWTECSIQAGDEICDNSMDDDCDGRTDENCPTCVPITLGELCNNLKDDDCDGLVDESCQCTPHNEGEQCVNDLDDDCDGRVDEACEYCRDEEVCGNNVDDDCDGSTDEGCDPCDATRLNNTTAIDFPSVGQQPVFLTRDQSDYHVSWYSDTSGNRSAYVKSFTGGRDGLQTGDKKSLETVTSVLDLARIGPNILGLLVAESTQLRLNLFTDNRVLERVGGNVNTPIVGGHISIGDGYAIILFQSARLLALTLTTNGEEFVLSNPTVVSSRSENNQFSGRPFGEKTTVVFRGDDMSEDDNHEILSVRLTRQASTTTADDEKRVIVPQTGEVLRTNARPLVLKTSDGGAIIYSVRVREETHLKAVQLDQSGQFLIGPPILLYKTPEGTELLSFDAASAGSKIAIVFAQTTDNGPSLTLIKHLSFTFSDAQRSPVNTITYGYLRLFPEIEMENLSATTISWIQTDMDPEFGGDLFSVRAAFYDDLNSCGD